MYSRVNRSRTIILLLIELVLLVASVSPQPLDTIPREISKRTLNITFLPCTCPIGFQPVHTGTLCSCVCDPILKRYVSSCSYENETVLRDSNAWIDYVNTTTEAGYLLYPDCPFDYCVDTPVNVNLNIPNGADVQCAFNRSGKLCGECKEDLSLVSCSSRCQECSNNLVSLIISFALAGILILNGLICYANILAASHISIVVISWFNLDLGIKMCCYIVMNSNAKVDPTYIILITVTIIIISEYSIRFATLIGKKGPVAILCTLILLPYSETIYASLQFTSLDFPDGNHIAQFITAIAIIILSFFLTVLIFWEWIQHWRNRGFIGLTSNPKYTFSHAYLNPEYRHWVGLTMLARILLYVVSAFSTDTAVLLSRTCVVAELVILKQLNKKWLLDILEVSLLINLIIFEAAMYYVREREANQIVLAATSLGISFIAFLGILVCHFYAYILKDTRCWRKFLQVVHISDKQLYAKIILHSDPPPHIYVYREGVLREDPTFTDDYVILSPSLRPRQDPDTVIDRPDQVVDDPHRRAIKEMEERD